MQNLPSYLLLSSEEKTKDEKKDKNKQKPQKNSQVRLIPIHSFFQNSGSFSWLTDFRQKQGLDISLKMKKTKAYSMVSQFLLFNSLKLSIDKSFFSKIFAKHTPIID